jgi:MFS family permease
VNQLLVPIPWISPQVVIGLPIMLFMLIVALGQPYLGGWSERVGRRRAMLFGAGIATVGFVATSLAYNLYDLLLWRSLCALGYAMVFVAAQGYVLDRTGQQNRAQGFALFIGAIMVATVCGPSIGGILADNIGFAPRSACRRSCRSCRSSRSCACPPSRCARLRSARRARRACARSWRSSPTAAS